jgi:Fe-S cluster assembly protein SufD
VTAADLPSPDEEVWRYSRIGEFDPADWTLDVPPSGDAQAHGLVADAGLSGPVVRVRNGRIAGVDGLPDGVSITPLGELADGDELLGRAMALPTDVFADANTAFTAEPVVVRVAPDTRVAAPIVVDQWIDADGGAVFPRLIVVAGAHSDATVVDVHGSAPVRALTAPVTELIAEPGARLRFLGVQDLAPTVWHIGSQVATIDRDAHLLTSLAALGGDYARHRIDTILAGAGGQGDVVAVYHGAGHQALDFRTFQDHVAPHTRSELLFKGAVDDHSRSIYTGLIRIEKDASDVSAFQTNRNVKLSPHAWAESVPNLEIENNDVRCSHASAVGPIDEDQRFYLESRGVPTAVAERLVVLGFYQEVLDSLPVPAMAGAIGRVLATRLEADEVAA